MQEPSSEWTQEERAQVAVSISRNLVEALSSGYVPPKLVCDRAEQIDFVLSRPPAFLEANREGILEGLDF